MQVLSGFSCAVFNSAISKTLEKKQGGEGSSSQISNALAPSEIKTRVCDLLLSPLKEEKGLGERSSQILLACVR